MKSIQDLREVRALKHKELKELIAKKDWNTAVDQPIYDEKMKEYDQANDQIKAIERVMMLENDNKIEQRILEAGDKLAKDERSPVAKLHAKWLARGLQDSHNPDGITQEEFKSIKNTMSVGTNSQGGYTVETEVQKQILDALKLYGGMRAVATILPTSMGNLMQFPASDGTAETGEVIGENTTATALDPSFSTIPLQVYKFSSKIIAIPFELLQDSNADMEAFINKRIRDRLGRIQNTKFTLGSGTAEPFGVTVAATNGYTASNATSQVTAILYTSLVELIHSVDPAYRGPQCKFMMADSSLKKIRQIVDSQGRPIFVPGYTMGIAGAALSAPDTIMGYGVQINQDVAAMAASAKSLLFGDFSYYYIRDVMDLTLFRFTDSAYAKLGQVGFLAWMRSGGNLIDIGGSVKTFINAAS